MMITINDKPRFDRPDEMENNELKVLLNENLEHYKSHTLKELTGQFRIESTICRHLKAIKSHLPFRRKAALSVMYKFSGTRSSNIQNPQNQNLDKMNNLFKQNSIR